MPCTGSCCCACGIANRALAPIFERRRAKGLSDRGIMRCVKRHIANEIYKTLMNPRTATPAREQLRTTRQEAGIPATC